MGNDGEERGERERERKGLTERVKQIYQKTWNRIRVGDKKSSNFRTTRRLKQGCPVSPLLFSIFISNLEEIAKELVRNMRIGQGTIWTLGYADDVVLLARGKEALEEMIKRLEKYLGRKKLELNVDKSKIIRFRRRGGITREKNWY